MELKTLKDLREEFDEKEASKHESAFFKKEMYLPESELKEMAVKWVKELKKQLHEHAVANINQIEWHYDKQLFDWIKHFFSITEEGKE